MRVAMEYKYMHPLSNRISLTVVIFTHSRSHRLFRAHYWAVSAFALELLFSHLFKWNSMIILRWYTVEYFLGTCEFSRAECTSRRALGMSLVCYFSSLLHITGCMFYSDCALLQVIRVLKETQRSLKNVFLMRCHCSSDWHENCLRSDVLTWQSSRFKHIFSLNGSQHLQRCGCECLYTGDVEGFVPPLSLWMWCMKGSWNPAEIQRTQMWELKG